MGVSGSSSTLNLWSSSQIRGHNQTGGHHYLNSLLMAAVGNLWRTTGPNVIPGSSDLCVSFPFLPVFVAVCLVLWALNGAIALVAAAG